MEASTLPAVRVEPVLRRDGEAVLNEGESLSDSRRKAARALNIRISSRDLKHLQVRAPEEGIPYETLGTSLLHQYVNGQLVNHR
jgi:hypothetical protein